MTALGALPWFGACRVGLDVKNYNASAIGAYGSGYGMNINMRPFKQTNAANNLRFSEFHTNRTAIDFSNCGHEIILLRETGK